MVEPPTHRDVAAMNGAQIFPEMSEKQPQVLRLRYASPRKTDSLVWTLEMERSTGGGFLNFQRDFGGEMVSY